MSKLNIITCLIVGIVVHPGRAQCVDENQALRSTVRELGAARIRVNALNEQKRIMRLRWEALEAKRGELEAEVARIEKIMARDQIVSEALRGLESLIESLQTNEENHRLLNQTFSEFLRSRPLESIAQNLRAAVLAHRPHLSDERIAKLLELSETVGRLEANAETWLAEAQAFRSRLVVSGEHALEQILLELLNASDQLQQGLVENRNWLAGKKVALVQVNHDRKQFEDEMRGRQDELSGLEHIIQALEPKLGTLQADVRSCWKIEDRLVR